MAVTYPPARPGVELDQADSVLQRKALAHLGNRLNKGQSNTSMYVTLGANVATTTVTDSRLSAQTCASFMPQTANAASEIPTLWVACSNGQMVIHHTNNALTDRVFTVGVHG